MRYEEKYCLRHITVQSNLIWNGDQIKCFNLLQGSHSQIQTSQEGTTQVVFFYITYMHVQVNVQFTTVEERLLPANESEGLEVVLMEEKGRGVVATRVFRPQEALCEYSGELLSETEGKQREIECSKVKAGLYVYYFSLLFFN